MKIKSCGESCFLLKTKQVKLAINPSQQELAKIAADIVVLTCKEGKVGDEAYGISYPGEYEVKGVFVYGYSSNVEQEDSYADIYTFDMEGIHIGVLDRRVGSLRAGLLDDLGIVNVLLVSLAENAKMELSKLSDLINRISPRIIVPMDYTEVHLADFIKTLSVGEPERSGVLDVKDTDFSDETMPMRLVVLDK